MDIEDSPLGFIVEEIRGVLCAGFFYAPVSIALTLPDICSALETEMPANTNSANYIGWCEKYTNSRFLEVKAGDIWALLCGIIHNAMLSMGKKNTRGRLILMPPNKNMTLKEALLENCGDPPENGLQVSIPYFCEQLIKAASDWWTQNQSNPIVTKNMADLVRYRPEGLAPFIGGVPVIA